MEMARTNPGPPLQDSQKFGFEAGYGPPPPYHGTQARAEWWEQRKRDGFMNTQFQSPRGHVIFDYVRPSFPTPATQSSASSSSSAVIPSWIENMSPPPPPRRRRSPARNTRARDEGWRWHGEIRDSQRAEHIELLEEVRTTEVIAARRKASANATGVQRDWTSYRDEALAQGRPGQRPRY